MTKHRKAINKVHQHIDEVFGDHVEACRAFLRQPSVSATGEGVVETAQLVRGFIEGLGGEVELAGRPESPIVYGRVDRGCADTLIIYGMYDVQPVEAQQWKHSPFGAEIEYRSKQGACIVARGAVNSKGALCGLFNALRSIVAVDDLPLNLVFTIEGEEEIGSPSFEPFIREHKEELSRCVGVADFDFCEDPKRNVTMHLGLKGIVYLELKARGGGAKGGSHDPQHSSANAWIASPVWRLVHALSSLVDQKETITIDGFYDSVARIKPKDRRLLDKLARDFDEEAFLKEMRAICFKHRIGGVELLKKGLYSPIINIDGIQAGYTGPAGKTILPRVATANIDIRFGPNLEPEEVVEKFQAHLNKLGFDDIELRVKEAYTWSKTDVDQPLVQRMIKAYRMHGVEPQVWPMATYSAPYFVFSRILELPVVGGGLGFGDHAHNPNEFMTIEGLRDFEKFVATFLYQLAG